MWLIMNLLKDFLLKEKFFLEFWDEKEAFERSLLKVSSYEMVWFLRNIS